MLSRGTAAETATAALLPSGTRNGMHSPVRRYPWDQAYPALRRLMAGSPMRATLTSLEYSNLLTGGPALATLGCLLQGLPPAPGPSRAGKPQARSSWWP
jgi:gentisate 1,2-dioxygenase